MRTIRTVILCLFAVIAVSAVASASASASATCFKVVTAGTGNKDSSCVTNTKASKNEYIAVEKLETQVKAQTPAAASEWCAKVPAGTGVYEDNKCTKAGGTKEYIKVFVPEYEVCQEGGTEKWSEHKCNAGKGTGKWSWLPIPAGKTYAVESTGGAFKLEGGGKSSDCTAVTNTGEIGPGGESTNVKLIFTGCTNDPKTCEAFAPAANKGKGIIEVTGLTDQLVEREGKVSDEFKENATTHEFVTIEFAEGANACPNYPATKVKGQVAGECKNITVGGQGETELVFPNPALKENTLEAFGVKATLFGTATVSLVNKWSYRCV